MDFSSNDYLEAVASECMEHLNALGIPYGDVREFTINRRAKSRWGQCQRRPDGYHININEVLCDGKHEDGLRGTLFHELIHTCKGCMNHQAKWKEYADIVSKATGLKVTRTNSAADKGFESNVMPGRKVKYQIFCPNCGLIATRQKRSRIIKMINRCSCTQCGSTELYVVEKED